MAEKDTMTNQQPNGEVGLIGLGLLGSALSCRLLAADYDVVGFDLESARCEELRERGGRTAAEPADVARRCQLILLSLPNSNIADQVLSELQSELRPGMLIVDTTTGDPDVMAGFGARLAGLGVDYVDATVGGSSEQTLRGEVVVMAGGTPQAVDRARGILQSFARDVFHVGPVGSGARMKLVFNLVLGLNRAVLAEGLTFARACGIDPRVALEVLQAGPTWSRVMDTKGAKMLDRDFEPQARLAQHLKDVRLILATGGKHEARLPLSEIHGELLQTLADAGWGDSDNSAVIKAFE